ncbi:MAG: hypothetical protein IJW83_01200 [Clostridia bacterium]|nr:hypothetical protein [Clostridia bacterium]
MDEKIPDAEIRPHSSVWEKLDNFWYHYKWHTLITLFLVVVVTVCTLQMCNKQSYDVYVMYAGNVSISRTTDDGTDPMYPTMQEAIGPFAEDRDGDGEVTVSLNTLYILSNKEIEEENRRREELSQTTGVAYDEVNASYIKDNLAVFQSDVRYSDYYICILSKTMYAISRTSADGTPIYASLASYAEGTDLVLYADDAILLSSTPLSECAIFEDLPKDTVICLRALSEVSAGKARNREVYAAAEATFRRMLGVA